MSYIELDPNKSILYIRLNHGEERLIFFGRSTDVEAWATRILRERYRHSGYALRNLSFSPEAGGPNVATVYTADHFDRLEFDSNDQFADYLDRQTVCWQSSEFYFDLEDC